MHVSHRFQKSKLDATVTSDRLQRNSNEELKEVSTDRQDIYEPMHRRGTPQEPCKHVPSNCYQNMDEDVCQLLGCMPLIHIFISDILNQPI